ncbi:MAG: hypothetical protein ACREHE_02075 [Rhizomicrobium sp.]
MIDAKAMRRAIIVGILLQVTLAGLGHYSPWIVAHAFLFAGMMISATAGYLYAQDVGPGHARGVLAGAIIGGACALVGFGISMALGDTGPHDFWLRTAISIVTGAVGGPFGQMSHVLKKLGY